MPRASAIERSSHAMAARLEAREVRLAASVPGLHGDEIGQALALADGDGLLVALGGRAVVALAPAHGAEVIQRVGRLMLVIHGATLGECPGQAVGALDTDGQTALMDDMLALIREHNRVGDAMVVPSDYLEVVVAVR